jgi:hypothetical protein
MKTMKPGERFKFEGETYAVEKARSRCEGCCAFEKIRLCNALPYCGDINGYIIFLKIKNESSKKSKD